MCYDLFTTIICVSKSFGCCWNIDTTPSAIQMTYDYVQARPEFHQNSLHTRDHVGSLVYHCGYQLNHSIPLLWILVSQVIATSAKINDIDRWLSAKRVLGTLELRMFLREGSSYPSLIFPNVRTEVRGC